MQIELERVRFMCDISYLEHAARDYGKIPGLEYIASDNSPVGGVSMYMDSCKMLYICFPGTRPEVASTYLLDLGIGFSGHKDEASRVSAGIAAAYGLPYFTVSQFTQLLISFLETRVKPQQPSLEVMQVFVFRALMFVQVSLKLANEKIGGKFELTPANVCICGHSLGGFYAQIAAKYYGFNLLTLASPGAASVYDNVIANLELFLPPPKDVTDGIWWWNFYCEGDPMAEYGKHFGDDYKVTFSRETSETFQVMVAAARKGAMEKMKVEILQMMKTAREYIPLVKHYTEADLKKAKEDYEDKLKRVHDEVKIEHHVDQVLEALLKPMFGQTQFGKAREEANAAKDVVDAIESSLNAQRELEHLTEMYKSLRSLNFFGSEMVQWERLKDCLGSKADRFETEYLSYVNERAIVLEASHYIEGVFSSVRTHFNFQTPVSEEKTSEHDCPV
jgi:hypothetical protein